MKNILIVLIFIARFALCQQHSTLGIDEAKNQLKQALGERVKTSINFNRAIKDKQTAIALAEPILF